MKRASFPMLYMPLVLGLSLSIPEAQVGQAQQPVEQPAVPDRDPFGADANPTGDPIGGGAGYRRVLTDGDYRVSTSDELLDALAAAKFGQVVYVEDDAEIDLSGKRSIIIPPKVTLASGRGNGESPGALIFTKQDKRTSRSERFHLFQAGGTNVRVTGLRLRGPDTSRRQQYAFLNWDGIYCDQFGLEVDNCELWGWSHGAVFLRNGQGAHIHHNDIHHCQRQGLGYGVVLDRGEVLIEANRFDYCRHAIAATGRTPSGYEARYNLVLSHANGHSFDMHGGRNRRDGTNIAGDWMKVHHNTFRATGQKAIVIRGRPTQLAEIDHNWFLHSSRQVAIEQKFAPGNLRIGKNAYGRDQIVR